MREMGKIPAFFRIKEPNSLDKLKKMLYTILAFQRQQVAFAVNPAEESRLFKFASTSCLLTWGLFLDAISFFGGETYAQCKGSE